MKLMFNECLEIRWKIAHFCILNFSRPIISFCLRSNIKHSTQCFITRWHTSKFVKNTPQRVVFSTLFSVFHLVMKHCIWCLIYDFLYPWWLFLCWGRFECEESPSPACVLPLATCLWLRVRWIGWSHAGTKNSSRIMVKVLFLNLSTRVL